ncbi:MAG: GMC family oxidoreductase [Actinomycetia bacterium]|nr:GMC family oxidoreductase [Actinomycetes bacterium]MCP4960192.1 GMC family oxidoreductase [Actinomycetes bacterium]
MSPARTGRDEVDVVVIGSGFGGAVSALRLAEKGWSVIVCEAGKRFGSDDFAETSWDTRRFLWAPKLGCHGIQRINLLSDVMVLSGAGVGGGSLVYANTLYEPLPQFYSDGQWAHIADWRLELAPHYDTAKRMLGVVENPHDSPADLVMMRVADEMGVRDTYRRTPVGVFFGEGPGTPSKDPFFGGGGPDRAGCKECGACMTGCRHRAKNTLDVNYLHLAESLGVEIRASTEVVDVERQGERWVVRTTRPGLRKRSASTISARHVVFAAGALGTQRLLFDLVDRGRLPNASERLGELTRTNSEAIVSATAPSNSTHDFTSGVAITSSFHPDEETHVEPVRYGKGSNSMALLTTTLVDGGGSVPRPVRFLSQIVRHPIQFARSLSVRRWSERSMIILVMQSHDNSLRTFPKKGLLTRRTRLASTQGHGKPNPTWIPAANETARRAAKNIGGQPGGGWNEAVLDIPATAHLIGGCPIGDSSETGVIDPYHRLYGAEGIHVVDGAAVSANLGVNPSLTIAAQAERAMAMWPNKGEPDLRPSLGEPYAPVEPVRPGNPAVRSDAPAALRW